MKPKRGDISISGGYSVDIRFRPDGRLDGVVYGPGGSALLKSTPVKTGRGILNWAQGVRDRKELG